jgi:CheY-like chemotaxis protein
LVVVLYCKHSVDAEQGAAARPGAARPAAVVLDLRLPKVDGYQVARRLRADPATAGAQIVAVSAHGREDEARAAGCDAFVAKPFDLDAVLGAVADALGRPAEADGSPARRAS